MISRETEIIQQMKFLDPDNAGSDSEDDEEERLKFCLTLEFGYGQYTLKAGLYDIFESELYYKTI